MTVGEWIRLKYVAEINRHTLPEDAPSDWEFAYVDIGAVTTGRIGVPETTTIFAEAPSRARRLAEPGDTVVSTVRTYLKAVAQVPPSDTNLVFSTGFAVVHPKLEVADPRYISYAMQADHFTERVEAASTGISYPAVSASDVGDVKVWLPDVPLQRAIADFLDRETAQIDAMVDAQERLVALLEERRAAAVQRAATQGIRPAELTYSGYDSVGNIPNTWTTQKLKRLVRMQAGGTPDTENLSYWADEPDAGVPWVVISDIGGRTRVKRTAKSLTEEGVASKRLVIGKPGTVLFAMYASVGEVSILDVPACWNQALLGLTPDLRVLDPNFLYYALHTVRHVLPLLYRSNTQNNLNAEQVSNLVLAIPPIDEQREIVCYLDHTTSRIDAVIAKTQESIALMKERRSALISAAVTGRIDVRTGVERVKRDLEEVGA